MNRASRRVSSVVSRTTSEFSTEFTADHVYDIRSAVVCLLDAIATFVDTQTAFTPESYLNLTQQIYNLVSTGSVQHRTVLTYELCWKLHQTTLQLCISYLLCFKKGTGSVYFAGSWSSLANILKTSQW